MQTMHKKALTVAIAGALAAPMAAQAVDFTISGHVNQALFIVDKDGDGGTKAQVANNGGSSTRVRVTGSTELEEGSTVGIQLEYQQGGVGKAGALKDGKVQSTDGLTLRHANVQLGSSFGKITIGQGSEAGDGSQYSETSGVFGIGTGAGTSSDFSLGSYFGSLDGGGRKKMVRYDTPALGPISAAVSVANDDRVSALVKYSGEIGGTSVGAQLATLQLPNDRAMDRDESTIGASFGMTMPSGLTLAGAWAKGKDMIGRKAGAGTPGSDAELYLVCVDGTNTIVPEGRVPVNANLGQDNLACLGPDGNPTNPGSVPRTRWTEATAPMPGTPAVVTDPSYYSMELGYKFGNSAVALSWYSSDDFVDEGSEGTAIGVGFKHTLPKAGAELYAAVQQYDVTRGAVVGAEMKEEKETVFMIGTRVKF